MVILFDLATRFDARPSPFCWRAKLALAHKKVPFIARPTLYSEIATLGDGSFKTLPVMVDDGHWCGGSFNIAVDLESRYSVQPTLFPDDARRLYAEFVEAWVDFTLHPLIFPIVALRIWEQLAITEQDYFRRTRERRLNKTLEEAHQLGSSTIPALREHLEPMRHILMRRTFLAGKNPAYVDYIAYGALKWFQLSTGASLVVGDDPIAFWLSRIESALIG